VEIGILALQGDVAEHRAALTDLGVTARRVRTPAELPGLDGIVMPGGESTTMSMLLESSGLEQPLGDALRAGLPAFGTCAGMILLGSGITGGRPDQRCYGMVDIVVRRNGFGRQLESFECDLSVPALGDAALHAVFIRAPVVERLGDDVEVLASLPARPAEVWAASGGDADAGEASPVLCRQGNALVAAFHPELSQDRRVHELFVSMVAAAGQTRPLHAVDRRAAGLRQATGG